MFLMSHAGALWGRGILFRLTAQLGDCAVCVSEGVVLLPGLETSHLAQREPNAACLPQGVQTEKVKTGGERGLE